MIIKEITISRLKCNQILNELWHISATRRISKKIKKPIDIVGEVG